MGRISLSLALLAILAITVTSAASAAPSRSEAVKQAVAGMKVSDAEMKAMRYSRMSSGKSRSNAGVWIPLDDCDGSLVIYLDRYNRVTGMRTTGDCEMSELKG